MNICVIFMILHGSYPDSSTKSTPLQSDFKIHLPQIYASRSKLRLSTGRQRPNTIEIALSALAHSGLLNIDFKNFKFGHFKLYLYFQKMFGGFNCKCYFGVRISSVFIELSNPLNVVFCFCCLINRIFLHFYYLNSFRKTLEDLV